MVNGVALIEAVTPQTIAPTDLPRQLADSITNLTELIDKRSKRHPSFKAAVTARAKGMFKLSLEAAEALARRGVLEDESGFYWANDQKLFAPSEIKLSEAQAQAFLNQLGRQALLIIGDKGLVANDVKHLDFVRAEPKLRYVQYDGDHHVHMTATREIIRNIAQRIQGYYLEVFD